MHGDHINFLFDVHAKNFITLNSFFLIMFLLLNIFKTFNIF